MSRWYSSPTDCVVARVGKRYVSVDLDGRTRKFDTMRAWNGVLTESSSRSWGRDQLYPADHPRVLERRAEVNLDRIKNRISSAAEEMRVSPCIDHAQELITATQAYIEAVRPG